MPRSLLVLLLTSMLLSACSTNNVTTDNSLQKYFDSAGVKGCFGLFDNGQGHFTIYNLARFRDSAYPAGSTLDILSSLIAVQTGVAANESAVVDSSYTLKEVFQGKGRRLATLGLVNRVGKDSLKKWVDSLRYGNRDLTGIDSPAENGHLKITADEQLGLTKKLYFDQLPFFQRTQKIVRDMFRKEENSNYRIVYKASRGSYGNGDGTGTGWIMGWVEENRHPYFFVVNMESIKGDADVSALGLQLVKSILGPMGFLAGKK